MLLYHDPSRPVYMLGTGAVASEILGWLHWAKIPNLEQLGHESFQDIQPGSQCVLGFSDLARRAQWIQALEPLGIQWCTYVHPTAVVHPQAKIGPGCAICPKSVIGWNVHLEKFVYVGDSGLIGHNTSVGHNVFFGSGCVVGGSCQIGSRVFVGLGSSIRDHNTVCDDVMFYMTSVVTRDIAEPGTYYSNKRAS